MTTEIEDAPDHEDPDLEDEIFTGIAESALSGVKGKEPRSVAEVMGGVEAGEWKAAMERELVQLEKLRTWELVQPPPKVNIIGSDYVFRQKPDVTGEVAAYKVRLVAKGYAQVYRIDYFDTFTAGENSPANA